MKTIIGVFADRSNVEKAIGGLREHNIADSDISYIGMSKTDGDTVVTSDGDTTTVAEDAGSGAVTGGVIGAIAGLVVANGILPGLGTLFVAGPIATALGLTGAAATTAAGAMTGAAAGGLIGVISGLGATKEEAQIYEDRIKSGNILLTAEVGHNDESAVRQVFEKNGAEEIRIFNS